MKYNFIEFQMHPTPGMVYRTIGGILDMYFFLGPTPENTAQQYTEVRNVLKIHIAKNIEQNS